MTNSEAIERLHNLQSLEEDNIVACIGLWYKGIKDDYDEAIQMAIEALQQQSLVNDSQGFSQGDYISRHAAIDSIEKHLRFGDELYPLTDTDKVLNHAFAIAVSCVYNLSSVQRTGEWIERDSNGVWECNQCHKYSMIYKANYCPNCGARMDGGE